MNTEPMPTPDEARVMLDRVGQLGASASAGASWAHIATLLTLGSATALGTLALGVTTGAAFVTVMVAMLVWVLISIWFMVVFGRATRLGFGKRWPAYMVSWGIAYVVAILLVSTAEGQGLGRGIIGACLITAVTVTSAVIEARS